MTTYAAKLAQPKYIMFVDDDEACHEVIRLVVHHKTSYKILSAYNAWQAMKMLEDYSEHVSLVFLDMLLPDMHGIELYNLIKDNTKMADIPIVFQTGIALSENTRLKELQKNNNPEKPVLSKPYTMSQLLKIINSIPIHK